MDAAHVSEELAAEKKKHKARPAWVNFATGASAALSGWMFVHPFDLLKVCHIALDIHRNYVLISAHTNDDDGKVR